MNASVHRLPVLLITSFLVGVGLLACSGSEETKRTNIVIEEKQGPAPSADAAETALNESLRAYNPYCVSPRAESSAEFPVTLINPSSRAPTHQYQQLWVLHQNGLLDTTLASSTGGLPVHKFSITPKGERTRYDIAQSSEYRRMFCYGVPMVTQIDSIKSVYNTGPNELAKVWYRYTVEKRRSWGQSRGVRNTFPGVTPLPAPGTQRAAEDLLVQVDSAWVERRLTGYDRPPKGPGKLAEEEME